MRRTMNALGVLLLFAAAGSLTAAQDSGNIYGHVNDESGAGLPGAMATLTGPTIRPLVTTTDARGEFHFLGFAPATTRRRSAERVFEGRPAERGRHARPEHRVHWP